MFDSFLGRPKQLLMRSGAMYQLGLDTGAFCDRNFSNVWELFSGAKARHILGCLRPG